MGSSDPKSQNPKVAATMFGDDTGFLSGLGIDFADGKTKKEKAVKKVEEEVTADPIEEEEKKPKKAGFDKEDITPTIKEAKIISRTEPTYPTSRAKGKTKEKKAPTTPSTDAVGELIQQKTKEQHDLDRSMFASKPIHTGNRTHSGNKSTGKGGGGRHRQGGHDGHQRGTGSAAHDGKITIGQTQRKQQSTSNQSSTTPKSEKAYKVSDSLKKKTVITISDSITVKEFSEKMGVPLPEVMKVLLSNKILIGAQANLDFDTAMLIATEFEVNVEKETAQMNIETLLSADLQSILETDKGSEQLISRPPIVTIMGHVDHGKTKLLDYLRHSNVVAGEAGGITQSIGASQIIHNDQKITFIDTPGHELFTSLRARGSKITDIVIIVVACDDGVKPQTVEAINHAKDSGVPIIVAITKIDLGINKIEEIKGQLAGLGLQPEDRGGETMLIPCSAVSGQGVNDLLDAVLLQYEMLERKYNPKRGAVGVVVEAHKDSQKGVTTSLLIMTGTLHIGDLVVIHNTSGKVRRMTDRTGKQVKQATGGDPVMILGMTDLPEPGRVAEVVANEKEAVKKIELITAHEQSQKSDTIIHNLLDKIGKGDTAQVKLILKADSFGSLEAIKYATSKIVCPPNIEIALIHADIGAITDSDILFAQAAKGIVIGYNVDATGTSKKKAEQLHVPIKSFDIIYQYIDYLEQLTTGMIEKEKYLAPIGKLEILAIFFRKGKEVIFGGKVIEGKIKNGATFKVINRMAEAVEEGEEEKEIKGTVMSLQREKDNVNEVAQGYECGMKAKVNKKLEAGDILEYYVWEER